MVSRPINRGRTERRRPVTRKTLNEKPFPGNGHRRSKHRSHEVQKDYAQKTAGSEESADSEDEEVPTHNSNGYNTLLASLQAPSLDADRPKKRRKLSPSNGGKALGSDNEAAENGSGIDEESGSDSEVASLADEPEDAESEPEEADENEEDLDEDALRDPFSIHFASQQDFNLDERVKKASQSTWQSSPQKISGWKAVQQNLQGSGEAISIYKAVKGLPIKQRLRDAATSIVLSKSPETSSILSSLFGYRDILYTSRTASAQALRDLASLHILNHILKGRDRVLRNNTKLASSTTTDQDDASLRDQGFTKPKVLVLLETREQCYRWIMSIVRFFEPEQRENWSRFESSFHDEPHLPDFMPDDYLAMFDGNADNDYRLGVKFTRKTIKLFASFYQADLLICSPLGLRRIVAHSDPKKRDSDFLSSIEILLLDQAHAMQAQNWDHVTFCLSHLNQQPRDAHGADFNRVRTWYLDGHARHLRQTIVTSSYLTPEINSLFAAHASNIAGRLRVQPLYDGTITSLPLPAGIKQTFSRFDSPSPSADPDARFAFFTAAVLPSLLKTASASSSTSPAGILLFVPSYLDFVRLRNFLAGDTAAESLAFGSLSEYASVTQARRARSHFMSGKHALLLFSGRGHHFSRRKVKGVKKVVWYGLPDDDVFYAEIMGWMAETVEDGRAAGTDCGSRAVFSRWDGLKLERIVGSERVRQMITDKGGDTYDFV